MAVVDFLFALIIALILSGLFAFFMRRSGRRRGFFWFFFIIFLAAWAGGIWIPPFGPGLWGISLLPFVLVGIIVALILTVFAPRRAPRGRHETIDMLEEMKEKQEMEELTYVTLTLFFWLALTALVLSIIARYLL